MPSYSLVKRPNRRRSRRRNMAGAVSRSARSGRFARKGVVQASFAPWALKKRKKRTRRAKGSAKPRKTRRKARRSKSRSKGYKFPTIRRNRSRRRNRSHGLVRRNRRRRRRNTGRALNRRRRRRNTGRSRNRRRRRNSGFGLSRRRNRRRRNSGGFRIRRRNPGIMGTVRDIFSVHTAKDVLAGTFGLSASLWGPKLAGFGIWAPLGRGYGGVATSVVSSVIASRITGWISPSRARITLISGLLGSFAGLLSAIHCGWRTQILPFETGLLACALPTMPGPTVVPGSPADVAIKNGMPLAAVRAARLPGLSGYGGGNAAGVQNLLSNEQAFRHAAGVNDFVPSGMNDYVQQNMAGSVGMRDYATFSSAGSSQGMDASPESF